MPAPEKPSTDYRDAEERAAIAEILAELPDDHPARRAYAAGVGTLELTRLVDDDGLARRLTEAWRAGYNRDLKRRTHFRP